jgi:putative IMPACT (imprinted ancient) family translation regulator
MQEYRTIAKAAVDEFTEKRSRFIGAIQPVKKGDVSAVPLYFAFTVEERVL